MDYSKRIKKLASKVPTEILDFSLPRKSTSPPTQASSDFITNKEQGDWAERLLLNAINAASQNYVAVHYGKNDDLVAGDTGFDVFYDEFQKELDTIGKRPDILIFSKSDFREDLGLDISEIPHDELNEYVCKAIAGIEVRSSAFLIDRYEKFMNERVEYNVLRALDLKNEILTKFSCLLEHPIRNRYKAMLEALNSDTVHTMSFSIPGWRASAELVNLNNALKELKSCLKIIQKRDYLSITPKVEDLKVVYKWIENFNVPHFYFQVFFDKIYGISFERILSIISDSDNEGSIFSVEQDTKNNNKTTIKIKSSIGEEIAYRVEEPSHHSVRRELTRGRLLFHVAFEGGSAWLNVENLVSLLNINNKDF